MTALLRVQQLAFAAGVIGEAPVNDLLAPAPGGGAPLIQVYRHAYGARLVDALRDNHEMLALAMGDEGFAALAQAYVQQQPSQHASIRWYGDQLAERMAAHVEADDGLVPHPALVDLARMDWALRGAFDAADAPVLAHEALATLPPEHWPGLRLGLHPSVQRVPLQWAVEAAWRLLREQEPDGHDEQQLPVPQWQPHQLLVWRKGLQTQWRSLDDTEAALLQAVAGGQDFAGCCALAASLGGSPDDAATTVATALAQWLADGLLSSLRIGLEEHGS